MHYINREFISLSVFQSVLVLLAVMIILNACDVTSHDDDHDDHADPVGFVIDQNNVEILRFENNQYTWNSDSWDEYFRDGVEGLVISPEVIELSVENPRGLTPVLRIRWVEEDGDVFDMPDLSEAEGGEYWVDWEWEKPNTLSSDCSPDDRANTEAIQNGEIRPANLEQHGSDGQWRFHIRADHAGEDRIRFMILHGFGDNAHADFTSGWMNVTVTGDEHELIDENGVYMHERDKCRTR